MVIPSFLVASKNRGITGQAFHLHLEEDSWLSYTQLLRYSSNVHDTTVDEFTGAVQRLIQQHKLSKNLGDVMLSTAEQFEQLGWKKGQ